MTQHPFTPWHRVLVGWHSLLAVAGVGGVVFLWAGGAEMAGWVRILLTLVLLLLTGVSGGAVVHINREQHTGRVWSLAINYLGFLASFFAGWHLFGIFTGLDSLADTFGRGVPHLAAVFGGYLITTLADRYEDYPAQHNMIRRSGRVIMTLFTLTFLWAVGLLSGFQTFFSNLTSLTNWLVLLAIGLFGLMTWAMWRRPAADYFGAKNSDSEMLNGYLFLSPNLLGFLIFFAGPLVFSLYVSFTNWDAFGTQDWIGLANYAEIFNLTVQPLANPDQLANEVLDVTIYDELTRLTLFGSSFVIGAADKLFWIALGNTLKFVLMAVPLSVIPALFLANLLNSKLPGMKFFRAVYFLPSVAAVVGIALVWQWLYNSSIGYINYAITTAVDWLSTLPNTELSDPMIRWLSESDTALLAVVIMAAWQWTGFNTVLFMAGLQNIPKSLYEAATVDGANPWQQFWSITLPLLAPTTFFVVTTTVIQAMQVFEQVFILISPNPAGPSNSTLTMVVYLYQKGFQRFEQGYASAIAWVLFLIIFAATLVQFQRQRTSGTAYDA